MPASPKRPQEPYLPLEDPDTVRLVVISPGDWESPISCRLVHKRLDENPSYVALSYAWGSPKVTGPVLVDGVELQVTVNLESALRHLRQQAEPLTIWIDAIAVNQQDLSERSHQVGLMRRIYQQASKVIVWLGDGVRHRIIGSSSHSRPPLRAAFYGDDRDSEHVAAFLGKWSDPQPSAKYTYTAFDVLCFIRILMWQDREGYGLLRLHASHLSSITEALRVMLLSQWWTRMWVFQEVIVASSVSFQYSGVEAPLEMFVKAASCLQDPSHLARLPSDAVAVLNHYAKVLNDFAYWRSLWGEQQLRGRRGSTTELIGLLRATAMRKSSDDRDRVFALLGLVDLEEHLVPDYQQSPAEVFISTCWASIHETGTLDVLCGDLGRKNRGDLPSWTVDWSAVVHGGDDVRTKLLGQFRACGGQKAKAIVDSKTLADLKALPTTDGNRALPEWMLGSSLEYLLIAEGPVWALKLFRRSRETYKILRNTFNIALDSGSTPLDISNVYKEPNSGRLCGIGRLVGIVNHVNDSVYEQVYDPDGLTAIAQATEWIAQECDPVGDGLRKTHYCLHTANLVSLVFGMKYVDGEFHRLQEEDMEALSCWGAECINNAHGARHQASATFQRPYNDRGFNLVFKTLAAGRRLFSTKTGGIGWGPLDTRSSDRVFVLPGGRMPFVLRNKAEEHPLEVYQLVGDCYLEGAMDGEWAPTGSMSRLQHVIWPEEFWSCFKRDMVVYMNQLIENAVRDAVVAESDRKILWETRPKLSFIDKQGVFETWETKVREWANKSRPTTYWPRIFVSQPSPGVEVPNQLEDSYHVDCRDAFRRLENIPKPLRYVVIE